MGSLLRDCCPECGSTQIIPRVDGFGCTKCQARFTTPMQKTVYILSSAYVSRRITKAKQLEALGKIHDENPAYTRKDLKMITGYSDAMIREHMKLYEIHYIRRKK